MTTSAALSDTSTGRVWRVAISVETLAYLILFLLALVLRWIKLGSTPLGEIEARQAIAAWHLLSPDIPGSGSISGVVTFAGAAISFLLATPTDAAARFVPMLGGIALTFSPLLFRDRFGRLVTLITVTLLTLSPTLVAASRQVDGTGLSMLGLVLALAAFDRYTRVRSHYLILSAGISLGFALLADYGTLAAIVALAGGVAFAILSDEGEYPTLSSMLSTIMKELPWRLFFAGLIVTLLIGGTLFFMAPDRLGSAANLLGQFANGITHRPAGVPYLGLVILLYEPGLLLFGAVGFVMVYLSDRPRQRFLAGWGIAALLVSLVYPGAMPLHSLWSVIPLAWLSGIALAGLFGLHHDAPAWGPWAYAAAVAGVLAMIFARVSHHLLNPLMFPWPPNAQPDQAVVHLPIDLLMALAWCVLLFVLWMAVAGMWGARSSWRGLGLGMAISFLLISLGQSGSLAFTRADSPYEPFNQYPAQANLTMLVHTARQVSQMATGHPTMADITVQADPNGALAWALRNFKDVTYVEQITPEVQTIIVITPADSADPQLGSSYVGQDLVIVRQWGPGRLTPDQFIHWAFYRTTSDSSVREMRVILWVREDVYRLIPAGGVPRSSDQDGI
ncbi:MAG: hypothetical protein JXB07_20500 [Anaerolineae bacterium]|nr:hypothetical protein [Anaerolineae bacterium]